MLSTDLATSVSAPASHQSQDHFPMAESQAQNGLHRLVESDALASWHTILDTLYWAAYYLLILKNMGALGHNMLAMLDRTHPPPR